MSISAPVIAIVLIHAVLALVCISHILLNKRDPRSALGWIVLSSLMILIGPFIYWVFGINRVQRRAQRLLDKAAQRSTITVEQMCISTPDMPLPDNSNDYLRNFIQVSNRLSQMPLTAGNHIEMLLNGDQAYPAMLDAIENAKHSIYLMTYIFDTDETGLKFIDTLVRCKSRGIDIRVLIDGIGELGRFRRASTLLRKKGISVQRFLPLSLTRPKLYWNLRNHRKLLLVDNQIAFTGGLNISSRHILNENYHDTSVEDIHFKLTGPVVYEMETVFKDDWEFATGERLEISGTRHDCSGDAFCRVIEDEPSGRIDRLAMTLMGVVSSAQRRIVIMTPYFLPPSELIATMQSAALRGIDITILLPQKNDNILVQWATRNLLWQLLQFNIKIYYQPAPFVHTKIFIVDDNLVYFGSANLDPRSLRLNFELNVEAYNTKLVQKLTDYVESKIKLSQLYTLQDVENRSLAVKYRDAIAWLCSPYL